MPEDYEEKCQHGETRGKTNEIKSKIACILEASESTRMSMENSLPRYHEDHVAGTGDNSLQHQNLVHKFVFVPQVLKILPWRAWRPAGRKTRFGDVWLSLAMNKWVKTGSCLRPAMWESPSPQVMTRNQLRPKWGFLSRDTSCMEAELSIDPHEFIRTLHLNLDQAGHKLALDVKKKQSKHAHLIPGKFRVPMLTADQGCQLLQQR